MSVRLSTFKSVLELGFQLYGRDWAKATDNERAKGVGFANKFITRFWEKHYWPDITYTEQRRFAKVYDANGTIAQGDWVYFHATGAYYLALTGAPATAPADANDDTNKADWAEAVSDLSADDWQSGTAYAVGDWVRFEDNQQFYQCRAVTSSISPDDASNGQTYWGKLEPFRRQIAYQQTEEQRTISSGSYSAGLVTVTMDAAYPVAPGDTVEITGDSTAAYNGRHEVGAVLHPRKFTFALSVDPGGAMSGSPQAQKVLRPINEVARCWRQNPLSTGTRCPDYDRHNLQPDGIYVWGDTLQPWVEFRGQRPVFTATAYDATTAYAVGDPMLFTDGDCYEAVLATTAGQSPATHPGLWRKYEFPTVLKQAVAHGIWSGLVGSEQDPDLSRSLAADADRIARDEIKQLIINQNQSRPTVVRQ